MDKFTDFSIVNPDYAEDWQMLVNKRELIAHMNPYRAVKSMKGVEMEKYHAMEHEYPSKVDVLKKFGYDPKQLHHLLRVEEYLGRYISGESYEDCLRPRDPEYLLDVKRGFFNLEDARALANAAIANVIRIADTFCEQTEDRVDEAAHDLLNTVQYNIMYSAIVERRITLR